MPTKNFPCPCCGHMTFADPPGSDDICPVCYWQDDASGLKFPTEALGPNKVSLLEAQENFRTAGASEIRLKQFVRGPKLDEPLDPLWYPLDGHLHDATGSDALYYWRKDPRRP